MPLLRSHILIALAIIVLHGCSGLEHLKTTKEDTLCPTIIEGMFHSNLTISGKVPCISARRYKDPEILMGSILRNDSTGILFRPQRESSFYSEDSIFFPNEKIDWAVDERGKIIRGTPPKGRRMVWDMELELSNDAHPKAERVLLHFTPNERFSYCIDAGTYSVTKITFQARDNYTDVTSSPPRISILARPNAINYLGDIYLDTRPDTLPGVHRISASIDNRPNKDLAMMSGLIGGVLYALGNSGDVYHTLAVDNDTTFSASNSAAYSVSLLRIEDTTKTR